MTQTFVIRVFVGEQPAAGLRGVAHHVSTGRERPFGDTEDLVAFIEEGLVQMASDGDGDRGGGSRASTG